MGGRADLPMALLWSTSALLRANDTRRRKEMFVVTLTYTAALEKVDALLPAHVEYLKRQYAEGVFLVSGRRIPRTGGVILAAAADRCALDAVLAEDPFAQEGVADYDVVEFTPTMTCPELEFLKQS